MGLGMAKWTDRLCRRCGVVFEGQGRAAICSLCRTDRKRERRKDEKGKARRLTKYAITSGKLIRLPCEECGAIPTHAHHEDYSRPLIVRWLCPKHHRWAHDEVFRPKLKCLTEHPAS